MQPEELQVLEGATQMAAAAGVWKSSKLPKLTILFNRRPTVGEQEYEYINGINTYDDEIDTFASYNYQTSFDFTHGRYGRMIRDDISNQIFPYQYRDQHIDLAKLFTKPLEWKASNALIGLMTLMGDEGSLSSMRKQEERRSKRARAMLLEPKKKAYQYQDERDDVCEDEYERNANYEDAVTEMGRLNFRR